MDLIAPSHLPSVALAACIGTSLCLLVTKFVRSKPNKPHTSRLPLPPGPKGIPLVGNLFDLPDKDQWLKATEWAKEYGEVVHVNAMGQHILYLNTYEAACDLLERRTSKYSDRPVTEMIKMIGADDILAFMPYGDRWRSSRRMFHQEFNSNTAVKYLAAQAEECRTMLQQLYCEPKSFENHVKHFSSGAILEAVYGIEVQTQNDPYVRGVEVAMESIEALGVGAYLVDFLPFLRYIPTWIPGANFKRKAVRYRRHLSKHFTLPFQAARKKMVLDEDSSPSMTTRWMNKIYSKTDESVRRQLEGYLRLVAGSALIAGYETTTSAHIAFIYLMMAYPKIQAKIQAELDEVVGRSRLPTFEDGDHLPYVNAVYKELIRWHPVAPLGIQHRVIVEDEYKGMKIPEGSIIIPNAWAMTHDKIVYGEDADSFRPERFLESNLRDPARIIFGFGRRICPGRHFAENSVFLGITSIVHLFKIDNAMNADGVKVLPEAQWRSGIVVHLEPYPCSITPRFEGVAELLGLSEDGP